MVMATPGHVPVSIVYGKVNFPSRFYMLTAFVVTDESKFLRVIAQAAGDHVIHRGVLPQVFLADPRYVQSGQLMRHELDVREGTLIGITLSSSSRGVQQATSSIFLRVRKDAALLKYTPLITTPMNTGDQIRNLPAFIGRADEVTRDEMQSIATKKYVDTYLREDDRMECWLTEILQPEVSPPVVLTTVELPDGGTIKIATGEPRRRMRIRR